MDTIEKVIGIVLGLFAIIAGLNRFFEYWKSRSHVRTPYVTEETIQPLILSQEKVLKEWRLFEFHRAIRLTDIYVQEVLRAPKKSPLSFPTMSEPIAEREILQRICGGDKEDSQVYIVVGQAGAGKSTLLRNWTLQLLAELTAKSSRDRITPIPIFFSLRYFPSTLEKADGGIESKDLVKCLTRTIPALDEQVAYIPLLRMQRLKSESLKSRKKTIIDYTFRKLPKRPPPEWIFLFDGLDEMSPNCVPMFVHWLQGLPDTIRAVLATRPGAYRELSNIPKSKEYDICDFNQDQINLFIHKWFHDNKSLKSEFANQIRENQSLGRLAAIPLLLTCLSMDVEVRQNAEFPKELVESELLRRVMEIVLDKWDATKEERHVNHSRVEMGIKVFAKLALANTFGSSFSFSELATRTYQYAESVGISKESADDFLRRVTLAGRVLVGTIDYGFSFGHAVFYDFFFAEGMRLMLDETKHGS